MLRLANVTFDCASPPRLAEFWSKVLGYPIADANEHVAMLKPTTEGSPTFLFLRVPEGRESKNRVHVDLVGDDREAEVERVLALGATRGDTHAEYGVTWTVLHDPEGNELCVAQH